MTRDREARGQSREVPVSMRIKCLDNWIGEDILLSRTRVLSRFQVARSIGATPILPSPPAISPISVRSAPRKKVIYSCLGGEIKTFRVCSRNRELEVLESGYGFSQKWIDGLKRRPQPLSLPKARNLARPSFFAEFFFGLFGLILGLVRSAYGFRGFALCLNHLTDVVHVLDHEPS